MKIVQHPKNHGNPPSFVYFCDPLGTVHKFSARSFEATRLEVAEFEVSGKNWTGGDYTVYFYICLDLFLTDLAV